MIQKEPNGGVPGVGAPPFGLKKKRRMYRKLSPPGRCGKRGQVVRQCGSAGLPLSVTQYRLSIRPCKARAAKRPAKSLAWNALKNFSLKRRRRFRKGKQQAAFPFDRYHYTGKMFRFCRKNVKGFQNIHEEIMKKERPEPLFGQGVQFALRCSARASASRSCSCWGSAFSSSRPISAVAMGSNTRTVTRPGQIRPPFSSSV